MTADPNDSQGRTLAEVGDKVSCLCRCHRGQIGKLVSIDERLAEIRLDSGDLIALPHSDYEPLGGGQ